MQYRTQTGQTNKKRCPVMNGAKDIMKNLLSTSSFLTLSRKNNNVFAQCPIHFTLGNGTNVTVVCAGVIIFEPNDASQKDIILSSGIHGNETAPIEICSDLVDAILAEDIAVAHRVMFVFGNLPAMDIAKRFVEENLNRLFGKTDSASIEGHRAIELKQAVSAFYKNGTATNERLHYDLHTAIRASKNERFAVHPYMGCKPYSREQFAFLSACDVKTVLLSQELSSTFSCYSSHEFNAQGVTVELGRVAPFGQNDMKKFEQARLSLLLLITKTTLDLPLNVNDAVLYRVNQTINKYSHTFTLKFSDDTANFATFKKGDLLATDNDISYRAEIDGEAVVFPNANVAIGQRAMLTVVPITISELKVK